MARLKLRYSLDEIIPNQYTFGKEWMTEDSVEYIGLYHKYTTGEIYTRPVWDSALSKKLVTYTDITSEKYKYDKLKQTTPKTYTSVQSYQVSPTAEDYKIGYINRYFAKKRNDNLIVEVSVQQYEMWQSNNIDNVLYDMIQIKWYISGNVNDDISNITVNGVKTKNKQIAQSAERKMIGINLILKNYTQFYADTDVVVPKDINE